MSRSSIAGFLTGTAVASVLVGGVAYAAASPTPTPTSTPSASSAPAATPSPGARHARHARHAGHAGKRAPLAVRAEHGQFTVATKKGARTVLVQRGTVAAVTPAAGSTPGTVTVVSADRFSTTYTVPTSARVLAAGKGAVKGTDGQRATAELKTGERVRVVAREDGSTATLATARVLPVKPAVAGGN
jgi:hypothetical protein